MSIRHIQNSIQISSRHNHPQWHDLRIARGFRRPAWLAEQRRPTDAFLPQGLWASTSSSPRNLFMVRTKHTM
ncbi:MAG: hypothetical protein JWR34_4814 [Mycobacterium sp.]|nr:hypothetical protein [Mycobacterium sp.]